MKTIKNMKYKCATILFVFLLSGEIFSQTYESTKKFERSFALDDQTEVRVYNKYGSINIIPWANDTVKFIIELKVTGKKDFKVEKVMEAIRFDFLEKSNSVSAITSFENDKGEFWKDVSDFANIIFKGGTNASIDYFVYLPSNQQIYIENKFGNIYTTDYQGNITVKISNGDIKANKLSGVINLEMGFGNLVINEITNGKLNISYADCNIRNAGKLKLESKSSTLHIDKAQSAEIDSKRDRYYIRDIDVLSGITSFSYINVEQLFKEIVLKTNYGDIDINMVKTGFQFINLISDYTDCRIQLPQQVAFSYEINYTSKANINLPDDIRKTQPRPIESDSYIISGSKGSNPKGKIKIAKESGMLVIGYYNDTNR